MHHGAIVLESYKYTLLSILKGFGQNLNFELFSGDYPGRAPSVTTLSATSIVSSHPETESKLSSFTNKKIRLSTAKRSRKIIKFEYGRLTKRQL